MGIQIRPYQGYDEEDLLFVWNASMRADAIDAKQFRNRVLLDPNFRPEHLPVALVNERVVGFVLAVTRQVPLFLQGLEPEKSWITAFGVHPDYRRQGIASALFEHVLDNLRTEGRRAVEISPYVPNYFTPGIDSEAYGSALALLLDRFGFRQTEVAISMGIDLTHFGIPAEVRDLELRLQEVDEVTILPVTASDLPDLMPFIATTFGWDWYRHAQEYLVEYFNGTATPIAFLVARQRGELVGYCQQRLERFGPFGVRPDRRNLGIGKVLLFRCLELMRASRVFFAYFMWTEENAARLYSSAGFKKRREFRLLRKDL